jgi:hypothetical protein
MSINFPTTLDELTNPTASDAMDAVGLEHDVQHSNLNDIVEALEAKVGVNSSAVNTTLDYLVKSASNPGHTHTAYEPALTKGNLTASGAIALDQTRQVIGGATVISHSTADGYVHLPSGGSSNQLLKNSGSSGTGAWGTVTENAGALAAVTTLGMTGTLTNNLAEAQVSGTATNYRFALDIAMGFDIVTGATDLGYRKGMRISVLGAAPFVGNLTGVYGIDLAVGNYTGATGTITTCWGLLIRPQIAGGTVTTFYGVKVDAPVGAGTITNCWGLYQESTTAKNVFVGKTYFGGTTAATARIHVVAGSATAGTAPIKLSSGTLLGTPEAGAIEYDGTNLYFTQSGGTRKTIQAVLSGGLSEGPINGTILRLQENDPIALYYGIFTVDDLTVGDKTYLFPNASGTVPVSASSPITLSALGDIGHATSAGNIHLPTSGSANQILKNSGSSGTGAWGTVTESSGALAAITTLGMSGQLTSTLAIGTSPFAVTSTTVNTNLNADMLDGKHTGSSGNVVPLMDGSNTWSGTNYISVSNAAAFKVGSTPAFVVDTTNNTIGIRTAAVNYASLRTGGYILDGDMASTEYYVLSVYPTFLPVTSSLGKSTFCCDATLNINDAAATGNITGTHFGGRFSVVTRNQTRTISNIIGGQFIVWLLGDSGAYGPVTSAIAGKFSITVAGSTITNAYGNYIENPTGAGAVTNMYGIYIADISKGGTLNAAIYFAGTSGLARQGLNWNNDTNLYRSGADILTTDDSLQVALGFGCNSKTPQTAYASGGAVTTSAGAYGFASDAERSNLTALVTNIRAALVANGIMS